MARVRFRNLPVEGFQAGDILFVAAKEPHRFHEIIEDLELLVLFAPAYGTR
jgi:hypothetical protein